MQDGTRLIFWIDMAVLCAVAFLVLAGQWDFVVALMIGLVVLNYFDRWRSGRKP
jgi:ABC-type proline/glycine betaine transport system permease subunit